MRQRQALAVMLAGESVFLTGPPGAGKTYVLNEYIRRAQRQGKTVAVTASTGIAATHIGGVTIHSWSGLGIKEALSDWDRDRLAGTDRLVKRYSATDVLVIDEVSMLHGRLLDMVDDVAQLLRGNQAPFGGMQVVLVGDLFQLPPVSRSGDVLDFVHRSRAWRELDPKVCYITEQHRQENDSLLDLLQSMRKGDVHEGHEGVLRERLEKQPAPDEVVTKLFSHNADVESINQQHLQALDTERKTYPMQTKGAQAKVEGLLRSLLAPEILELRTGAEVMFVANNFAQGFANGSRGRVIDFFDGKPVVELVNGRQITVEPHTWTVMEDDKKRAEAVQYPLRLAWATTIHKSQGMNLDAAEINLSRSFTPGMGYVALSRVRSIDGVYLKGINNMALAMHPDIFEFDAELRAASDELSGVIQDAAEVMVADEQTNDSQAGLDDDLLERLKRWRTQKAAANHVPPYVIAHNAVLETLATRPPATPQQLLGLPGFGQRKLDQYGDDILAITRPFAQPAEQGTRPNEVERPAGQAPPLALDKQPSRAPGEWTEADDKKLLHLFYAGTPLNESAILLGRDPDAIWARLTSIRQH